MAPRAKGTFNGPGRERVGEEESIVTLGVFVYFLNCRLGKFGNRHAQNGAKTGPHRVELTAQSGAEDSWTRLFL